MIAIYPISSSESNPKYLGLTATNLIVKKGKESVLFDLFSVTSMTVERKKKLMPLISGGVIASLSALAMFIFGVSMNLTVFLAAGMLLFYFSMYEYSAISLVTDKSEHKYWLPQSHPITMVRPFVGLVEYFAKHKHFPAVYTSIRLQRLNDVISDQEEQLIGEEPLEFTFFASTEPEHTALGIDLTRLSKPMIVAGDGKIIGTTNYKINRAPCISIRVVVCIKLNMICSFMIKT